MGTESGVPTRTCFVSLILILILLCNFETALSITLQPPTFNLAAGRHAEASSTCGEINGKPIREMYCTITGANPYNPLGPYNRRMTEGVRSGKYSEMRSETSSFLQDGHNCEYCEANSDWAHPASNMVDGTSHWYQSPPLSRGMQYSEVNITIDLEQAFYIAHVWIQMANSPRPGTWILEHSTDFGKTYQPWQYFASSPSECSRTFGIASLSPIQADNSVICTSEYSNIHPMENAEIMINLLEGRPGSKNFSGSTLLQEFTNATNVRFRLLRPKTLQGHLMDLQPHGNGFTDVSDATVTRRYYYSFKEVIMSGRCICNGHAATCDILDPNRSRSWLCRCEHNTEGDNCDRCKPGFLQKKWRQSHEKDEFVCEPCNCHGHAIECAYDNALAEDNLSLDIHGNYEGGGRCLNCQHNTQGINCNECRPGFYRPRGKTWLDVDVCQPCVCDPEKHTGNCVDETGQCECLPQFAGPNCDQCAPGFYHPPECRPCECNVNGTRGNICLPVNGNCPCKPGFSGKYCEVCAPGFTNIVAGCHECGCDVGSLSNECDLESGKCSCKSNFGGQRCEKCAAGYFGFPDCEICDCDQAGSEDNICDATKGQCLCMPGYVGERCDRCDAHFYGYPACKECDCNAVGSKSLDCDQNTGECPCYSNFTSRTCDKCAAGYFRYPQCLACGCHSSGSKGLTCDNDGQCYCKPNFEGERCNRCRERLYNFPICEECNCNPNGVVPQFAGCDRVPPGELCLCKENVMGRTCSQCKPNTWDLQLYHPKGCIDCDCNITGTVSLFNSCDQNSGQCICKRFATGQKCDVCADGYYNLQAQNHFGCQPCDCDTGGSIGVGCHLSTGQCRCKPRIEGRRCNRPILDHYYPTLWHNKYEAEDGRISDGSSIRYAIDPKEFPGFSWRGFVVFSQIQPEIILDITIRKAALYKLLLHYRNPTELAVDVNVRLVPTLTQTTDFEQQGAAILEPSGSNGQDKIVENNKKEEQKFVLNPGRWRMHIKSQKRLFLDYVVLIPSEYYQASSLTERVVHACKLENDSARNTCLELRYPPLVTVSASHVDSDNSPASFEGLDENGVYAILEHFPSEKLPTDVGSAVLVKSDTEHSKEIRVTLDVPETGIYYLLVEYHQLSDVGLPIKVRAEQNGDSTSAEGLLLINHCPYNFFCRDLMAANGRAAMLGLEKSPLPLKVIFFVHPGREFALNSVHLIKEELWNDDFLQQVSVCVKKDGKCIEQGYPLPPKSILTEAEAGINVNSSIVGEKLPFSVTGDTKKIRVMSLDDVQSTLDMDGVVAHSGAYVFVIHYYNPDNPSTQIEVLVQNERFAFVKFQHCPSRDGCRAIVFDRQTGQNSFLVDERYALTLYANRAQKGPIYVDYVIAVPLESYSEAVLRHLPIDLSSEFLDQCSQGNFANRPNNTTKYCQDKIFSLTSEFNTAALSCDCNPLASLDFACEPYGGQCKCKPNVVGRTCDRCAPGYYNYPECVRCSCATGQLCDETTGKCLCPPFIEGRACERCVQYAYGFDPLIGCQLCGCSYNGSADGELLCDSASGQCLCKENVGGRQCDRCLPGYFGFPACNECDCEDRGTLDDVCDDRTAKCLCKKNVIGERCNQCRPGAFDLRNSDVEGCSECFCFHMTDRCQSSNWPMQAYSFDDQSWLVNDPNGNVFVNDGEIIYTAAGVDAEGLGTVDEEKQPKSVYFVLPVPRRDYTLAYGLHLYFTISSFSSSDRTRPNTGADIKLVSDKTTLEYWGAEQSLNESSPFKVVVTLYPEYWLHSVGEPSSRSQLMMTLLKLEKILIKASHYEKAKMAILKQFELEQAEQNPGMDGLIKVGSVELCECPSPYTGPSCQLCSSGYYRVPPTGGSLLGACILCNCHGHTGTCDPDTGICLDCQHNTEGEHCERCKEGFYGNATTGSAVSCLRCPCPYPTEENNFALSCLVTEHGILERCICREGYIGEQCDECSPGFFGYPKVAGGQCQKCDCNENNNILADGACNPFTGDCALCEANTDGRHCEYCREWYYGDAVEAKNCTSCKCDECGSVQCENKSGKCECKNLVQGSNCDRCAANAWGFTSCKGCRECNCEIAASNSQCDAKSGQCFCMPGASGMHCEQCEHGFWNYSPQGCTKCDCEADLSMGTVCDVTTGQCHCQQGATGSRCDQCQATYLRIPKFGCRHCDECVFALKEVTDELDAKLITLNTTIGNVSKLALASARLNRFGKQVTELEPLVYEVITTYTSADLPDIGSKASALKDSVSAISIRAERAQEQLTQLESNMNQIVKQKMSEIRLNTNSLRESVRMIVQRITEMQRRFEQAIPLQENREQLIADAEQRLAAIRAFEEIDNLKQGIDAFSQTNQTAHRIFELKAKSVQLIQAIEAKKDNIESTKRMIDAFNEELSKTRQMTAIVKKIIDSLSLFNVKALISGIEKDSALIDQNLASQREAHANISNILASTSEIHKIIKTQIAEIIKFKSLLEEANRVEVVGMRRRRRHGDYGRYIEKVEAIEAEANKIVSIFESTKNETRAAIEAVNVYRDVVEILKKAGNYTAIAKTRGSEARARLRGQVAKSNFAYQRSQQLLRDAEQLQNHDIIELQSNSIGIKKRLEHLSTQFEQNKADFQQINITAVSRSKAEELTETLSKAEQIYQGLLPVNESLVQLSPAISDLDARVKRLIEWNTGMAHASNTARDQIQQVDKMIPETKGEWEQAKIRLEKTIVAMEEQKSKLALLKEKIAVARDKANGIKLGAHFGPNSLLELPIPQQSDNFGMFTEIRFFFRTSTRNGFMLFLGSKSAYAAGEYIAIELEDGLPKLVLNFGSQDSTVVALSVEVNDNMWREMTVKRVGRKSLIRVTKPNADDIADEQFVSVPKTRMVLNLFDDYRKLFIGAAPSEFKMPRQLQTQSFVGDIQKLRVNGEQIGLWNSEHSREITGAEMRSLLDSERSAESEATFNGKGYMQFDVGSWNPRKKTAILLSFSTYSPDGLLFFVGKDRDQLILELVNGRVSLSFDLGSGPGKLISTGEHYNDGKWHLVQVDRVEQHAKLKVDDSDKVEGESPGERFEMSISDSFYIGGLPQNVETRFTVQPFRGCIRNLKLDTEYVSLARPRNTKGVREISFLSERSYSQFSELSVGKEIELSFRFRMAPSTSGPAHIATVMSNSDQEEYFSIYLENNVLIVGTNGDEKDWIRADLTTNVVRNWHYVTIQRTKSLLALRVDDAVSEETQVTDLSDALKGNDVLLVFGRYAPSVSSVRHFIGCVGDVIFDGKLLSFAKSNFNEVKLDGCANSEGATALEATTPSAIEEKAKKLETDQNDNEKKIKIPKGPSKSRPDNACALPKVPYGEREDSIGTRFGLQSGSRLEFDFRDSPLDQDLDFSIHLRATTSNGIVFFVSDEKHTTFLVLFMIEGRMAFSFGSGHHKLTIKSSQSLLDDEWHGIRVEREGQYASLYIDDKLVVENRTLDEFGEFLSVHQPVYIGGLPTNLVPFASRILPGVKSEFGGCLRGIKLNGKDLTEEKGQAFGVGKCSQFYEDGIYFGKDGGYAIINPQFVVGLSFSLEMEVKPRTKNAVLLSVGVLEFLTLQIINGTVKFSVDNGAGVESVVYDPPSSTTICDGHWHRISLYKKKNLITLNVDGKSNLRIMKKKSASETSTRDPLYLGGVPKDIKLKGLDTSEPYVGCVRILSIGRKQRKRDVDASEFSYFGAVERKSCPLN